MSDDDPTDRLRTLLRHSKNVKQIARDTGVGYLKLHRFTKGRTRIISLNDADRVLRHLTGRGAGES